MKHTLLSMLFAVATLTSCVDEDFIAINDVEVPTEIADGYSLNFTVTLDPMGGTATTRSSSVSGLPKELTDMENYIDLEKFRVLFFDKDDKFLFESKSRWVKKLETTDPSRWLVSVPVFSYGNDTEYDWDWETIRKKLIEDDFKIAILANRPGKDVLPELSDNKSTEKEDARKWFDNTGPHWRKEQTIWYAEQHGTTAKDVFDLHHSQYDPIYENKNNNLGHYDFIMTYDEYEGAKKPFMSSTSSWVDWGDDLSDENNKDITFTTDKDITDGKGWRYAIHPSETNPIPMYGIQKFKALGTEWKEGTAINLSRDDIDKPISLLRSVVRIELLIPKKVNDKEQKKPEHISLWYSDIYARCEPMDVWTPTDQIWGKSLDDHLSSKCEMDAIMNYGPIANYKEGTTAPANAYQERLSWVYGAWKEKGWEFKGDEGKGAAITVAEETSSTPYPHIFNPCIQRNNTISCVKSWVDNDPNYYRCVVYTGERNVNDPTNLADLQNQGNLLYWAYTFNKNDNYNFYYVPITDYSNPNNPVYAIYDDLKDKDNTIKNTTTGTVFGPHHFVKGGATDLTGNYMEKVKESTGRNLPYALIRNHVYRLILAPTDTKTYAYQWDFTKDLNAATISNLNADDNWNNPGNTKIETLSSKAFPSSFKSGTVNSIDLNWGDGAKLTREGGTIQTGEEINGETSIKTKGKFTLTVPTGKVATELTLYSYINVAAGNSTKNIFTATLKHTSADNDNLDGNSDSEVKSSDADITGGTMHIYNNNSSSQKIFNKTNNKYYFYFGTNSLYYEVVLDEPLAVGDEISTTLYSGSSSEERGILISNKNTRDTSSPSITIKNSNEVNNCTYIVKDGDGLAGASTIYIYRYNNGINFDNFKINRSVLPNIASTYWSEVNGTTYTEEEKGLHFLSGQNDYDKYVFTFDPTNEITFTSTGEQVCFTAEVRTINKDGKPEYWKYQKTLNGEQTANGNTIYELQGLKFSGSGSDATIYIYEKVNKICVTGATTITLPDKLQAGYTVTIKGKSSTEFGTPTASGCVVTAGSGLELNAAQSSNTTGTFGNNTNEQTFTWEVTQDETQPVFTLSNNTTGIDFYEISVNLPASNSARSANANGIPQQFKVKSEDLYSKSIRFDNILKYKK